MLTYILIGLVVLLLVFVLVVARQPGHFQVTRSIHISAPPEVVFAQVNELRKWEAWSPWAKLDPAMKLTYDGPASGVGAISAWCGNSKVGEGRNTIVESRAPELIRLRLEFLRPFKCTNDVEFTFRFDGRHTVVTWGMTGKNNFMAKAFGLVMNMDKMVGGDFEKGLAALKSVAESAVK